MKPISLYLLTVIAIFSVLGVVHASDSDDILFGEPNLTDQEMRNFNRRLDEIADKSQQAYKRRVEEETERRKEKGMAPLTEEEKTKIFKECFQAKFDYAQHEIGNAGTIFDIGDKHIFDLGEEI